MMTSAGRFGPVRAQNDPADVIIVDRCRCLLLRGKVGRQGNRHRCDTGCRCGENRACRKVILSSLNVCGYRNSSVPIPKFVSSRGTRIYEFRNRRTLASV